LSSALAYFWLIGRHRSEVRRRLAEAVDTARIASLANRARALVWAAQLGNVEGRPDQAVSQAQEAHEIFRDIGDPWWTALSEAVLGLALGHQGEIGQADELMEAARVRFAQIGDDWGVAIATMLLGLLSMLEARPDRAVLLAHQCLEGFRAAGDQWGQIMALELLGLLARRRGAYADAISVYEEALGVVRDLGLRDEAPFLLVDLGDLHALLGDVEMATVLHKEALDRAQELGARDALALARKGLALARKGLALAARRQGDYRRASELLQAALAFYREAGFTAEIAHSLVSLGCVEELRGDLDAAEIHHREGLCLARDLADKLPLALVLEGLACVATAKQQPERAAVLLGAAESVRTNARMDLPSQERADVERATAAAVSALGREAFTAMVERGRRMSSQEIVAYELHAQ
jgi:tetratricopeptide (TPR) repeat protein